MSLGETYVIRIYRRGARAARGEGATTPQRRSSDRVVLAGLIEDPVSGETRAFRGLSELVAMICEAPLRGATRRRKKG